LSFDHSSGLLRVKNRRACELLGLIVDVVDGICPLYDSVDLLLGVQKHLSHPGDLRVIIHDLDGLLLLRGL
jgi:hypothetical protein